MALAPATRVTGTVNAMITSLLLIGVAFIIFGSASRWLALLKRDPRVAASS
jgi:hypothetical protein